MYLNMIFETCIQSLNNKKYKISANLSQYYIYSK